LKLINTFLFSNIFLSVGAVLLTVSAQVQLGMTPHWQPYLSLIFFATLIEYNRTRVIKLLLIHNGSNAVKQWWIRKNKKKIFFIISISIVGFIIAAIRVKTEVLLAFLPLGILSFFYSFPVSGNKNCFLGLREVPYLKIFLIAFVWSATTILLPVIQANAKIFEPHVMMLFAERFFFIFAITIPFDIRDMQADQDAGLKTIPLLIDKNKALSLSYISLSICFVISILHYKMQNNWFILEAIFVSLLTTYLFLKLNYFRNLPKYYYQILDGTMLLQGLLVLGFYYFAHSYF
jgi:4-hydroxybenzoate polyprenyltransferase